MSRFNQSGPSRFAGGSSRFMPQPKKAAEPGVPHEVQATQEVSKVLEGFRDRAKQEAKRFKDATDSEYWCAFCFQTRDQKEEFLKKLQLIELGDKYLDGLQVAKVLGVKIESPTPAFPKIKKDRAWERFTKKGGE